VRLRGEVIDSIVGVLDGLSAEELNWRPVAPATNSLYAIATHVLGNAEDSRVQVELPEDARDETTGLKREVQEKDEAEGVPADGRGLLHRHCLLDT
jgi:hypothetical protein